MFAFVDDDGQIFSLFVRQIFRFAQKFGVTFDGNYRGFEFVRKRRDKVFTQNGDGIKLLYHFVEIVDKSVYIAVIAYFRD